MYYTLQFRDKALFELREAYIWYEKKQVGLGKDFRKEITDKIDKIVNHPYHYKNTHKNYHEALVDRFPFIILYAVKEKSNEIIILAIFHTSRNPHNKYKK